MEEAQGYCGMEEFKHAYAMAMSRVELIMTGVDKMVVEGCRIPDINGNYKKCESIDGFQWYKTGEWEGKQVDFMIMGNGIYRYRLCMAL